MKFFADPKTNYLYFGYVILVLIGLLIWMTTEEWSDIPDVVAYLGFALTLTSLVLSLVAIFQSLLSGSSIVESISNLHNASTKVEAAALKVEAATSGLSANVVGLKESLNKKRPDLESTESITNPEEIQEILVTHFLAASSLSGLCALKIAVLSARTGKEFSLKELFGERTDDFRYAYGYLVASSSLGLFKRNHEGLKWSISAVNTVLNRDAEAALVKKLEVKPSAFIRTFSEEIDAFFE